MVVFVVVVRAVRSVGEGVDGSGSKNCWHIVRKIITTIRVCNLTSHVSSGVR